MGSHMSCIGFFVESYEDFRDLMLRAVENGERIETLTPDGAQGPSSCDPGLLLALRPPRPRPIQPT